MTDDLKSQLALFSSPTLQKSGHSYGFVLFDGLPLFSYNLQSLNPERKAAKIIRDSQNHINALDVTSDAIRLDPIHMRVRDYDVTIERTAAEIQQRESGSKTVSGKIWRHCGPREESILDAIKQIAMQSTPIKVMDKREQECLRVRFTLSHLRRVLSERNSGKLPYNNNQILEGLEVLNNARYRIILQNDTRKLEFLGDTLISNTVQGSRRNQPDSDDQEYYFSTLLHPLITVALRDLDLFLYDYKTMNVLKTDTAKRLYKYLSAVYIQAGRAPYTSKGSELLARLGASRAITKDNVKKLRTVFKNLQDGDVLDDYDVQLSDKKMNFETGRTVHTDRRISLQPSDTFVRQMRRSNTLRRQMQERLDISVRLASAGVQNIDRIITQRSEHLQLSLALLQDEHGIALINSKEKDA
ncbi:hypothetical protein [Marinobacterium jannaschii]|uniref:hypothetical protein n=1 Tax=Marinobacterium jannaschii TaxID=64970 RepID=UPI0004882ABC|nr:hypothetical protein [Marinobacterium jannaschii]